MGSISSKSSATPASPAEIKAMLQKEKEIVNRLDAAEHRQAVELESQAAIQGDPNVVYCKPLGEAYQRCLKNKVPECQQELLDLQACGVVWGASVQLACANELHKARAELPDMAAFEKELKSYTQCVARRSAHDDNKIFPMPLIERGSEYGVLSAFLDARHTLLPPQPHLAQPDFDVILTDLLQQDPRKPHENQ